MSTAPLPPLRLHGWVVSPFCYKVLFVLAHKRLDYTWVAAPILRRGELKKRARTKKVPVLEAGDAWIADSTRIVAWLEQRCPEPSVYPADARDRAVAVLLEDWADEALTLGAHASVWTPPGDAGRLVARQLPDRPGVDYALGGAIYRRLGPTMMRRIVTARRSWADAQELFLEQLDSLERLYERGRPFVFGEEPSIADFAISAQLANMLGLTNARVLAERPRLDAVVRRLVTLLPPRFCSEDVGRADDG